MRKPEQRLWDAMKRARPNDVRLERIENIVGEGIPDVLLKTSTGVRFVELKVSPSKLNLAKRLFCSKSRPRVSQLNWHAEGVAFGVVSYFLLSRGGKLFLVPGRWAIGDEILEMVVAEGLQYAMTWPQIYQELTK